LTLKHGYLSKDISPRHGERPGAVQTTWSPVESIANIARKIPSSGARTTRFSGPKLPEYRDAISFRRAGSPSVSVYPNDRVSHLQQGAGCSLRWRLQLVAREPHSKQMIARQIPTEASNKCLFLVLWLKHYLVFVGIKISSAHVNQVMSLEVESILNAY
jgi:hypothetical protein